MIRQCSLNSDISKIFTSYSFIPSEIRRAPMNFQIYLVTFFLLNSLRILDAAAVKFDSDPDVRWENFKKTYQKVYEAREELIRRKNFENNFKKITEHNQKYQQGNKFFQLGFNEFADMALEEFANLMTGLIIGDSDDPLPFVYPEDADVPDSIDWREAGAVTPVKNQGQCGSCYAFSATGALEGQNKLKHGNLTSLSEQNIVDCTRRQGNLGCGGGWMNYAFEYVKSNGGLDSEKSYPYKDKEGRCSYKKRHSATKCYGYTDIVPRDEDTLKIAVGLVGPIATGINAGSESFQLYKGGVYDEPECDSDDLDHAVLVVGYGSENGTDYWLLKNSWGTSWGEDGYMKLARNRNNMCGVVTQASFPMV